MGEGRIENVAIMRSGYSWGDSQRRGETDEKPTTHFTQFGQHKASQPSPSASSKRVKNLKTLKGFRPLCLPSDNVLHLVEWGYLMEIIGLTRIGSTSSAPNRQVN